MPLRDDLARALIEVHPLDAARVFESLDPGSAWLEVRVLDDALQAALIEEFSPDYAARLLLEIDREEQVRLVRDLPSEVSADLLPYLPEGVREDLLAALPNLLAEEIEELGEYPEDTAGSVMSPDFTALRADATVSDALRRLRRLAMVGRNVSYVYVVDDEDRLVGVLLMRDLVLAGPSRRLRDLMVTEVARAYADDPLDRVADLLRERHLLAVPIVDDRERLKGVIDGPSLLTELQEEGFEDAQKMFGAGSDEHASSAALFAVRKRLPWLHVNLVTAFMAAAVVAAFDGVIAQLTILAAFLPVVAGQGGNAGAQALAVMLRSLALDEVGSHPPLRYLVKEARVGLVNGAVTGVVAGLVAALATGRPALGVVTATAMVVNLVLAGTAGAAIPLVMNRLGQDPAQSSNIILTTVTDIVGFASFLGFALLARPWLL